MARPIGSRTIASRIAFKQRDVERALRAVRAQEIGIGKIEIDPRTGRISITPSVPESPSSLDERQKVRRNGQG